MALEYLKVILTWQVIVLVLVITFLLMFKENIRKLLDRIEEGEGYGLKIKAKPIQDQQNVDAGLKPEISVTDATSPRFSVARGFRVRG